MDAHLGKCLKFNCKAPFVFANLSGDQVIKKFKLLDATLEFELQCYNGHLTTLTGEEWLVMFTNCGRKLGRWKLKGK